MSEPGRKHTRPLNRAMRKLRLRKPTREQINAAIARHLAQGGSIDVAPPQNNIDLFERMTVGFSNTANGAVAAASRIDQEYDR